MLNSAKILIVEDNADLCHTLADVFTKNGHEVLTALNGKNAQKILKSELIDLVLLDLRLPDVLGIKILEFAKEVDPDILVVMMTAVANDPRPAVEAMKVGAFDYLTKPFELDEVKLVVAKALETVGLKREVSRLRQQRTKFPDTELFGHSPAIVDVKNHIKMVSETPRTSVLIQGESGTGKELVANTIHQWSARQEKAFIPINCGAIPETLLESEIFGHEKGAFTDAKALKKGMFELANAGTIFLDEISSMQYSLQPKLLRVLETQTFRRVGGIADIKLDVRIVAASNRDLQDMVNEGTFREDLYYRLKVMVIALPPLRKRIEDIIPLTSLFISRNNKEFNKNITGVTPNAEELLCQYRWPGNIRELKNVIERATILCQNSILEPEHLPIELRDKKSQTFISSSFNHDKINDDENMSLNDMEKIHIQKILTKFKGNKSKTARILNISRSTLREKIKLYNIL